jgi:site-specific DNA-methyltransferase (adenine-specific)
MGKNFVSRMQSKLKDFPMHVTEWGVLVNADNLDVMKKFYDNAFDLLLTDPPYGIGEDGGSNHSRGKGTGFETQNRRKAVAEAKYYTPKDWDKDIPPVEYFQEALRITKDQINFGGNYFQSVMIDDKTNYKIYLDRTGEKDIVVYDKVPALGATTCWIVWDKMNGGTHFADCELAWASFKTAVRKYEYKWNGMLQGNMKKKDERIHPTQKPVQLMRYLLRDYTKEGDKVIDTHSGSGTTAISCIDMKRYYLVIEKDKEYFEDSSERIEKFKYGYNSRLKDKGRELPQRSLL